MMTGFQLITPRDLEEALRALGSYGPEASLLAGATDLGVLMRSGARTPRVVVWIGRMQDLKGARRRNGTVCLGSGLTHAEVAGHSLVSGLPVLRKAAASIGSPQIRNAATAGGNLANASPAADLAVPLLALDARVLLRSSSGERLVAVEDLMRGPGLTCLEPNEIIVEISFEVPGGPDSGSACFSDFVKLGLRDAVAISVASAAIVATARDGKLSDLRVACGAVAPRPLRMRSVEALVRGQSVTAELLREVEAAASGECDPITDIRATAGYRRHVAGVLVARLVESAWRSLCSPA
jgi:carbon-monoxide dehydrogenase medium subunit